jgi:hypothetical protein
MSSLSERVAHVIASPFSVSGQPWPPLDIAPESRTDRFLTLLQIYDLMTAPLQGNELSARWAGHPAIAAVKLRLEDAWIAELDAADGRATGSGGSGDADDPVRAMRALAARDRLPAVYHWVAEEATLDGLRRFLAIEGGPDGGFDDLVALCQVGLSGAAKLELGRNYWDEMGDGDPAEVHTDLHRQMAGIVGIPVLPRADLPKPALERAALGGLLATNRWLQPEMLGALGLTELQAGPRCRLVLQGFERLGLPREAQHFYAVHADVDPRHGKDWLEKAIAPIALERPEWGARMVRGARWRWQVNAGLFDTLDVRLDLAAAA